MTAPDTHEKENVKDIKDLKLECGMNHGRIKILAFVTCTCCFLSLLSLLDICCYILLNRIKINGLALKDVYDSRHVPS